MKTLPVNEPGIRWVQGLSRGPRGVLKFHLCVRRSGVLGCRNENFACVLLCVFVSLDGCEVDRRRDPCAFYVPLCACVSRVCPVCVSRLPPVSFYRYRMANNELARLGDAGVGVSCRHAPHASGPHHTSRTVAASRWYRQALSSHISHSSHRIISLVTNLPFTIPFTSPTSPFSRARSSIGSFGRARHPLQHRRHHWPSREKHRSNINGTDGTFSSPPSIPYSSSASVRL